MDIGIRLVIIMQTLLRLLHRIYLWVDGKDAILNLLYTNHRTQSLEFSDMALQSFEILVAQINTPCQYSFQSRINSNPTITWLEDCRISPAYGPTILHAVHIKDSTAKLGMGKRSSTSSTRSSHGSPQAGSMSSRSASSPLYYDMCKGAYIHIYLSIYIYICTCVSISIYIHTKYVYIYTIAPMALPSQLKPRPASTQGPWSCARHLSPETPRSGPGARGTRLPFAFKALWDNVCEYVCVCIYVYVMNT